MQNYYFTIFVPTYNRAYTLPDTLQSIENQTFRDFEVVIIDDGSTDNTKALIESWQQTVSFSVKYHYQENQGKHIAHNHALQYIEGKLVVTLDSDDILVADGLATAKALWESIPADQCHNFAGITMLCRYISSQKIVSNLFPKDPLDTYLIALRKYYKIKGEIKNIVLADILKQYPFPQFVGERYMFPSLLGRQIADHYLFRCSNQVIQEIEFLEGGLTKTSLFIRRMKNIQGMQFYHKTDANLPLKYQGIKNALASHAKYIRFSLHCRLSWREQYQEIQHKILWLVSIPRGLWHYYEDKRKLKKQALYSSSSSSLS